MAQLLKKTDNTVFIVLSSVLIAYLWLRGYYVPIVFDEAATFFHFVHRGDLWFFSSLPDANNHLLNTLTTYISYNIFGSSKLALRIPNLLSAVVFLYYLYRCSQFVVSKYIRWIFILCLMFAHFFVEFFALSRGYGLSMAFLFGVFYHLLRFSTSRNTISLIWISLFLILAELSNLSLLVLVIAIIGYEFLVIIAGKPRFKIALKQIGLIILTQIIPLIFASYYMFYLNEKGSLYYGDSSGFWNLTVQSLILLLTGTKSIYYSIAVVVLFLFQITGIGITIWLFGIKITITPRFTLSFLLVSSIIGVILLSVFFGINHPEDRVAMYFIPLFLGSTVMVGDYLFEKLNKFYFILPIGLLLFMPVHFLYSVNLNYVNGYKTEVLPEKFYDKIISDTEFQGEIPPTIGGYRMRTFCWVYLNYMNGGTQNLIDYVSYPEIQSDFQIVDIDENPDWMNYYDVIDTEPVLGRKLLKRKIRIKYSLIDRQSLVAAEVNNSEYSRLATWNSDSLTGESYYITANLNIRSLTSPFQAWFVMQLVDDEGGTISYKYIPFDWLQKDWSSKNQEFKHSLLTGTIPKNLSEIKIYIWNLDKVNYSIEKSEISIYEIE